MVRKRLNTHARLEIQMRAARQLRSNTLADAGRRLLARAAAAIRSKLVATTGHRLRQT
jgi:hypothetical protein